MKTLVLGIGNQLLADEGVGVHAAQILMKREWGKEVTVLDVGTAILDALPELEQADRVIVVDAMKADGAPGTIYRVPFDQCARNACIGSMHGFDLSRVLALAGRSGNPPEVVVIGVEPALIGWSLELSPAVAQSLPATLAAVEKEIVLYL